MPKEKEQEIIKVVRLTQPTHAKLSAVVGELMAMSGCRISYEQAINALIDEYYENYKKQPKRR